MGHAFPQETVELIYGLINSDRKSYPREFRTLYRCAQWVRRFFFDSYYSFEDSLRTGNYAPYWHEARSQLIAGNNCTTIIPTLYLHCEAVGLKPQIVQFLNFRDLQTPEDKKDPVSPSHFALILDVGRKHHYLIDPFWKTFGPILANNEHSMKIGKCGDRAARRREYEQKIEYSPEQFAAMMDRLKDPAESLDMLVAGQKVYPNRPVPPFNCQVMAYYTDETNTVSTRLWIPHVAVTSKAVYCHTTFNNAGRAKTTYLDLFLAKDHAWIDLTEGKKVATADWSIIYQLRNIIQSIPLENIENGKKKRRFRMYDRLGPVLHRNKTEQRRLLGIVEQLHERLTVQEQAAIKPLVLARTLYEATSPEQEYLSTLAEHDYQLLSLIEQEEELGDKVDQLHRVTYRQNWKLIPFDNNEHLRLRRKEKRLNTQKSKIVREIDDLNHFRRHHRKFYDRTMDKVLFAKTLGGLSVEGMNTMMTEKGFDWRWGYLGIVVDFIPFIVRAKKDLTLRLFMDPIREKIRARKGSTAADKTAQTPAGILAIPLPESTGPEPVHRQYDLSFF